MWRLLANKVLPQHERVKRLSIQKLRMTSLLAPKAKGRCMLQIYTCLTVEHDLRLVGLAAVVCLFGTFTGLNLFRRALARTGALPHRTRCTQRRALLKERADLIQAHLPVLGPAP